MADGIRVALVLATVGDLSGSGGAERQFSDLFEFLQRQSVRVQLITSSAAVRRLRDAGRLAPATGIVALPLGRNPGRGKAGIAWLTLTLLWATLWRRSDVIHICQPTPAYLPFVAVLTRLPAAWRPRVTMTIVDCTLAPNLLAGSPPADLYERQVIDAHRLYSRWTRLDGVFSWYRAFVDVAAPLKLFAGATFAAAKYCFTNVERFAPSTKGPVVIFAGRLSAQKRPLLFVDAVDTLLRREPELAASWRFAIYGRGPLDAQVRERIERLGLSGRIEIAHAPDLSPVFATSKLFVSTQAYENFTSLAMLEAMAAGNAVIAEDAGQTREFVHQGVNGWLVSDATPETFADAMAHYMRTPELHERMGAESRRIATEVHTIKHFADDIMAFWKQVVAS